MIVVTTKNGTRFEIVGNDIKPAKKNGETDYQAYELLLILVFERQLDYDISGEYLKDDAKLLKEAEKKPWFASGELVYDDIDAIDPETGKPFVY